MKSYPGFEVFFPLVKNRVKLMYEIRRITKLSYKDVAAACNGNFRINIGMFHTELCDLRDHASDYARIGCRQETIKIPDENVDIRPYFLKNHRKRFSRRTRVRLMRMEEAHLREIYGDDWKDHAHYNYD